MAGKGSDRRDNFRKFNNGLYFWLKDNPGLEKTDEQCSCGKLLYVNPVVMSGKRKFKCRCGHEKWK